MKNLSPIKLHNFLRLQFWFLLFLHMRSFQQFKFYCAAPFLEAVIHLAASRNPSVDAGISRAASKDRSICRGG